MSLLRLAHIIKSPAHAAKKFRSECWKRGFGCPRCGCIDCWKHGKLKNGLRKYRCRTCRHVFSDQSATPLKWNKVRMDRVAAVSYLHELPVSIRSCAEEAEISKGAAERLRCILRRTKGKLYVQGRPAQLSGVIEMDETKIAKEWFWGGIERKTNLPIIEPVTNRSETVLSSKIWKYVAEGSTVITDEWRGYQLHPRFFRHLTVNHSQSFVHPRCRKIHTNRIEGFWKQIKRTINHRCNGVAFHNILDYIHDDLYRKSYPQSEKASFFPLSCLTIHLTPPSSRT